MWLCGKVLLLGSVYNKIGVSENTTPWQVHPVSLSFCLHLSLSMNGQMAIWLYTSDSNDYLAIHTQNINIFYLEMSSQIAIQPFSIKKDIKIPEQPNGNLATHKSLGRSHSNSNANANRI